MKTGVLVHGCNLNIENWRYVAWGDPPLEMGRIPQGLLTAVELDADVIVFGTGASRKEFRLGQSEKTGRILVEAEYSLEFLQLHFDNLRSFAAWKSAVPAASDDAAWEILKRSLLARIRLDMQSQNTVEEIRNAGEIFLGEGIGRAALVSSPSHIVRCLRDACSVFTPDSRFSGFCHSVHAVPASTCYEGSSAGDVVVVEPPHRPDRHVVPTHRRIQRMLALQKLSPGELVRLIEEFDDLLQRYEQKFFNG